MHTIKFTDALGVLSEQEELSRHEIGSLFDSLFQKSDMVRWAALLTALALKGESTEEVIGAVDWLRGKSVPIPLPGDIEGQVIDCCGTGGDKQRTLNISTLSALVASSGGALIMKHGSRSASGNFGSIDLVEALGIPIARDSSTALAFLERAHIAFLDAPSFHPALKMLAPIRKTLGIPTIFNIAAPIAHPAWIEKQIVGVWKDNFLEFLPQILCEIGIARGLVVYGNGLDEFTTLNTNEYTEITGIDQDSAFYTLDPSSLELCPIPDGALSCASRDDYIEKAQKVISGTMCPESDIVALNAGAILFINDSVKNIADGFYQARELIRSGALKNKVRELQDI